MKNIRIVTFLTLPEQKQNEYRNFFKHSKAKSKKIGRFTARNMEFMRLDDIIEIKTLLQDGREFKAMSLFFCLHLRIPYVGLKKTFNPSENSQGTESTFFLVRNWLVFIVSLPWLRILFTKVQTYFLAINYLTYELERIHRLEKRWRHYSSPEREQATGKKLSEFGYLPMIRGLGQSLGKDFNEVLKMTWAEIDRELSISAAESYIEKSYADIMKKKQEKK